MIVTSNDVSCGGHFWDEQQRGFGSITAKENTNHHFCTASHNLRTTVWLWLRTMVNTSKYHQIKISRHKNFLCGRVISVWQQSIVHSIKVIKWMPCGCHSAVIEKKDQFGYFSLMTNNIWNPANALKFEAWNLLRQRHMFRKNESKLASFIYNQLKMD